MPEEYAKEYKAAREDVRVTVHCGKAYACDRQSMGGGIDHKTRRTPVSGATIGERIQARAQELGLSKAELVRQLELDRSATLHEWIADKYEPRAGHLRRLAVVLQMTLEELVGVAEGQSPPFESWAQFLDTPEGRGASPEELRTLAAIFWPPGREPTLFGYQMHLAALRGGTKPRG
jgi:transcriptional regulator with XRE-family HTH domain